MDLVDLEIVVHVSCARKVNLLAGAFADRNAGDGDARDIVHSSWKRL